MKLMVTAFVAFGAAWYLLPATLLAAPGSAPEHSFTLRTWQTDDGLPENSATVMAQTPDGYLRFVPFNGPVRFDDVGLIVFDPGIGGNCQIRECITELWATA